MNLINRHLFFLALLVSFIGCASSLEVQKTSSYELEKRLEEPCFDFSQLSLTDQQQADSLLQQALEQEALHTLVSTLKPMSDVVAFNWKVEKIDTLESSEIVKRNRSVEFIDEYEQLERISAFFSCGPLLSSAFPFENLYNGNRYVQFRIYRTDAIDKLIERNPEFWSKWAFVEGSNPAIIISVMEYEDRMDRFLGYGYLYGYPEHAVNFFVDAARHEEETGEFVERDFMNLPVVSKESGRFVYAVEKGYKPRPEDHRIKEKAQENVDLYLEKIEAYRDQNGNVDHAAFLRNLYLEKGWIK